MMMNTGSLLCDEELPESPRSSGLHQDGNCRPGMTDRIPDAVDDEEWKQQLKVCLERQKRYLPRDGYTERLRCSSGLSSSRLRAVRWIIMARSRLNLAVSTVFLAINYLDRFISLYLDVKWECWMIQLLSIACTSIAAKFDEVDIPSLHDFQMEDLHHSFQPSTIQRMELVVLRALDWELNSVTAHSFVDMLTWRIVRGATHRGPLGDEVTVRATELLLGVAFDVTFLEFNSCTLALSALKCSLEELAPSRSDVHLSLLDCLIPQECMELSKCHKCMEERVVDPLNGGGLSSVADSNSCPMSPVTVIPTEQTDIFDCCIDIDVIFKVQVKCSSRTLRRSGRQ